MLRLLSALATLLVGSSAWASESATQTPPLDPLQELAAEIRAIQGLPPLPPSGPDAEPMMKLHTTPHDNGQLSLPAEYNPAFPAPADVVSDGRCLLRVAGKTFIDGACKIQMEKD